METLPTAFLSQCAINLFFYPYRDYVKTSNFRGTIPMVAPDYILQRWKGMITQPVQLTLVSLPTAFLLSSYVGIWNATHMWFLATVLSGCSFTVTKSAVRVLAIRMESVQGKSNRMHFEYNSMPECIVKSTKRFGFLSWFQGSCVTCPAYILWHAVAIHRLHSHGHLTAAPGFFDDLWSAFHYSATGSVISAPIRNTFKTALYVVDRGDRQNLYSFAKREVNIIQEGVATTRRMLQEQGPHYLFRGNLRVIFRTSVPFAFWFAAWRQLSAGTSLETMHRRRF